MSESERTCDVDSCRCPRAAFNVRVDLVSDPQKPQNKTLALVMSATRNPPLINNVPNPDHDPADLIDVARWCEGFDVCSYDCFLNKIDEFWRLGQRRAKRLWAGEERDWR